MNADSILDKPIVLSLNRNWQPIGYKSVRQAISAMNSTENGEDMAAKGMQIEYKEDPEGVWDFEAAEYLNPITWVDWVKLPVRPFDNFISCAGGYDGNGERILRKIRVPTVVIAVNCDKMPMKEKRLSNSAIHERDELVCQYSGKKLTRATATVDHVIPRDVWKREGREGSPDQWTNLVTCEAKLNHRKGNRLNEQMGMKLIREPKAPLPMPVSALINEIRHQDWKWFIS